MPKRKVLLKTEEGEHVTDIAIYPIRRVAPFREWAIVPCLTRASLVERELPVGVEAEIALVLMLRAHTVTRTAQIAQIVTRDIATVCRALRRLETKKWVIHVDRGEWKIHHDLVYYGKWKGRHEHGKHAP